MSQLSWYKPSHELPAAALATPHFQQALAESQTGQGEPGSSVWIYSGAGTFKLCSDHLIVELSLAHLICTANLEAGWLLLGEGNAEKQSKKYKAVHGARFRIFFPIATVSQINISLN